MENETPVITPVPEDADVLALPPGPADGRPGVRYMDDATFQRCLEKVVTVHDRLLAELAK